MNSALPVAERLLALEGAVAALAEKVAALGAAGQAEGDGETGAARLAEALGNVRLASILVRAGYTSVAAVQAAPDEALLAVDGVAERTLALIRERLGAMAV